jgi:glycosyltransferase involved in cell wall biosynthesis
LASKTTLAVSEESNNTSEMKISIALTTFNGCKYLSEQLFSFVTQTRLPDELIVVDDCSSDGTVDMLYSFSANSPFPVRIVQNEKNLGHGQSFGKALSLCSGDLIFISDQDDVWFKDKIETVHKIADEYQSEHCFLNDAIITDEYLSSSQVSKMEQISRAGLPMENFVMGCCTAVRRDFLDIALPIPKSLYAHDSWIIGISDGLRLTRRSNKALQYYRRHGQNVSQLIVNEPKKIGFLRYRISRMMKLLSRLNSGDALDLELAYYLALIERISERRDRLEHISDKTSIDEFFNRAAQRLDVLSNRSEIRKLNGLSRTLKVTKYFYSGGYSGSGGLFGAIKDVIAGSKIV